MAIKRTGRLFSVLCAEIGIQNQSFNRFHAAHEMHPLMYFGIQNQCNGRLPAAYVIYTLCTLSPPFNMRMAAFGAFGYVSLWLSFVTEHAVWVMPLRLMSDE